MRNTFFLLLLSIFNPQMGLGHGVLKDSLNNVLLTPVATETSREIANNLINREPKETARLAVESPEYCIPTFQDCTSGDRFQTLKIKEGNSTVYSINNNACEDGYGINDADTIKLKLSTIYDLELDGLSSVDPNGVVAWIDYNNNGEFEPSEQVLVRNPTIGSIATQSFTTPAITGSDIVRMRIKVQFTTLPEEPCNHSQRYGDTQDFIIQFEDNCDVGPLVSGVTTVCSTEGFTKLTVGCPTAKWYTKAIGGTLIHSGNEFVTPALTAVTSYYVECVYGECTTSRTKVTVNYNPTGCESYYCDAGSLRCDDDNMITNVLIKKGSAVILSNQSSCGGSGGYTYYDNQAVILEAGETYQITIENPGYYIAAVKAWIDYNGNGVFEPYEEIFSIGPAYLSTATQSFTVPGNIAYGAVRMRVKLTYNVSPEPCDQSLGYGETEDYLIHLVDTPPCQPVVNLVSPADDMSSGTHLIQAAATGGKINAENKVSSSAKATYEAASIQMNPGFIVEKGAVFTAKTGGCD